MEVTLQDEIQRAVISGIANDQAFLDAVATIPDEYTIEIVDGIAPELAEQTGREYVQRNYIRYIVQTVTENGATSSTVVPIMVYEHLLLPKVIPQEETSEQ